MDAIHLILHHTQHTWASSLRDVMDIFVVGIIIIIIITIIIMTLIKWN